MPPRDDDQIRVTGDSTPDELRRAAEQRELQMRSVQKYPGWRFHKTKPAVIVNSPEQEKALGAGWSEEQDPENTALGGNVSAEVLRGLALQTEQLAEQTARVAGVQSASDRRRAESTNLLREATGARDPGDADERTERLRELGQQANRETAEQATVAREAAEYNAEEADRLAKNVGRPTYRARKAAQKNARAASAKTGAAKTAKKSAAKKGKLGGTRR
jgi:hypothetical protein